MAYIDTVKPWFETGDFPTQAQFYAWMDYIRWKDEALAITDITGLQTVLNGLANPVETFTIGPSEDKVYTIPAGYLLETVVIFPLIDCQPYLSTETGSAGDIIPADWDTYVTPADGASWKVNVLAVTDRNVVLAAVPENAVVVFIKRKIR